MPHLIGLVLLGAGLYAGYRGIVRLASQMKDELQGGGHDAHQPIVIEKDLGALEYDPATGVYRPRQRR